MAFALLPIFLCLLTLLPIFLVAQAQSSDNFTVGASHTASGINSAWLISPSGDFAFGLQHPVEDKDLFFLTIWHAKIPEKTIVWFSSRDNPAPRKTESLNGTAAFGILKDTGNFVLQGSKFNSNVWESFNDPRDTLLPMQIMERRGLLSSRLSGNSFSKGRFQLQLLQDGNLVLNSINLPTNYYEAYYETDTNGDSPGLRHPKASSANESWTALLLLPDNICNPVFTKTIGPCGFNSICTLDYKRPVCKCPTGYSLLDPNDQYGSCKPDFLQGCEEDELSATKDLYKFEVLNNIDWPFTDYMQLKPFAEEQCKQSCIEDCTCAVAISRLEEGVYSCWKKKLPLSNGRVQIDANNLKALIKVRKDNSSLSCPPFLNPEKKKWNKQNKLILVGSVLLSVSAFLILVLLGAFYLGFSIYQKKLKRYQRIPDRFGDTNLHCFTYEELEKATNGFKEELGRGAFGIVYKGAINMSSTALVAVKRLTTIVQVNGDKEFKNEVNVIGHTHHKNLVRLLGFCKEGPQRLLVYEYMSNGTLASFLFADSKPNWKKRIQFALVITRGLLYLHEECSTQIIHRDIKPQNILLAKLLLMNQSQTHTAIRGTEGYVAAEWFRNMPITAKVDVYSFGVLLLEIVCCRRSIDIESHFEEPVILTDLAYDCYKEGTLEALVGKFDEEALNDKKKLERLVMVALWCIQEDPSLRPTMRKVIQMLEGVVEVLVPPCPYPYTTV
ncbi:Receptor-like protein kinase [Quillaja saponaria]|uniref:non-specific serine/threonine protein kinase n=1 Tax=Quillaja saponaria TaxID=32244 RepID=A0AAD7LHW9_QUISA|nr:Receptor-like protein kinase [Quillaja saponaria]